MKNPTLIYTIARHEAAIASAKIRAIKDANEIKKQWGDYCLAKEEASVALTKVALIKTYAEYVGEALKETIYVDLPAKKEFSEFLFLAKPTWKRNHGKGLIAKAYRSIIRTQNRLKKNKKEVSPIIWQGYEAASNWEQARREERSNGKNA